MLNLTQHEATAEQVAAGVIEPSIVNKPMIQKLLTFTTLPTKAEVEERAEELAKWASDIRALCYFDSCMIGGAPYLMEPLARALSAYGLEAKYAYSERVSEEQHMPDGSVRKVNVFKHVGFV